MSYLDAKRARERALVRSIHGAVAGDDEPSQTSSPRFDGGARVEREPTVPAWSRPQPVGPPDEVGWGPEYEIEDGASLLFPWLEDD